MKLFALLVPILGLLVMQSVAGGPYEATNTTNATKATNATHAKNMTNIASNNKLNISIGPPPNCTLPCFRFKIPPAVTNNPELLCTNNELQSTLALCVASRCSMNDQYKAYLYRQTFCRDHPSTDRTRVMFLIGVTFGPIALFALALRCLSRYLMDGKFSWEDYIMIPGALAIIGLSVAQIKCANLGFGKHYWDINPHHVTRVRLTFWLSELFYILALGLLKLSIILFCRRVLWVKTWFRCSSTIVLIWSLLTTMSILFATIFQCMPIHTIWDSLEPKHCVNLRALAYAAAALNVIQDIAIFFLPLPTICKLQMSKRQRFGVMSMFSFGLVACVLAIARIPYIITLTNSADFSYMNVNVTILAFAEFSIGTICGCMPHFRYLCGRCFPWIKKITSSITTRRTNTAEGNSIPPSPNPAALREQKRLSINIASHRLSRISTHGHLVGPNLPSGAGAGLSALDPMLRPDHIDLQPMTPAKIHNKIWASETQEDQKAAQGGILVKNSLEQIGYASGEEEEDCRRYGIRGLDGAMDEEAMICSEVASLEPEKETEKENMI